MAQADCESKPDVGSSRKSNNDGLATNSTPIDNFSVVQHLTHYLIFQQRHQHIHACPKHQ